MNYEEKYKEALNKAKSKIENDNGHVLYEDDIVDIFPELQINEDKKIIKGLIKYLKADMECNPSQCESFYNKSIVWLEKQDEQKSSWSEKDEKMWAQVINEMEAIKSNSSTIFEKNIVQNKIDWFKSLKYRIGGE